MAVAVLQQLQSSQRTQSLMLKLTRKKKQKKKKKKDNVDWVRLQLQKNMYGVSETLCSSYIIIYTGDVEADATAEEDADGIDWEEG
ncbi:hypothetical protein ACFX2I_036801 [Malus domestica]